MTSTRNEAADLLGCLASQPEYIEGKLDWVWQLRRGRLVGKHVPGPIPLVGSRRSFDLARRTVSAVLDDDRDSEQGMLTWREMYAEAEARLRDPR